MYVYIFDSKVLCLSVRAPRFNYYFNWQLSVATSCRSVCRVNVAQCLGEDTNNTICLIDIKSRHLMNTRKRFNVCAIVGMITIVINGMSFLRIVTEMHPEVCYLKHSDREVWPSPKCAISCVMCEVQTLKCVIARGSVAADVSWPRTRQTSCRPGRSPASAK